MLCSRHFTDDCFEPKIALAASFGITKRKKLKPIAVPSLFEKHSLLLIKHMIENERQILVINRLARNQGEHNYEKRERSMVSMFLYTEHAF